MNAIALASALARIAIHQRAKFMTTEQNQSSSQSSADSNPEMDQTPQYDQPESGYRTEEEEEELRQSSPLNPRVAEKSEEAMEEA